MVDVANDALASALIDGGASVLQLRMKDASTAELIAAARWLVRRARAAQVLAVVDDRIDVALAAGADGVHLGQEDLPLADARRLAAGRADFLIGISTHCLAHVEAAVRGGADYLGYGPVFATTTKENPDPVQGLEALAAAVCAAAPVPVVAIGGVTPERAAELAATGACAACAISSVNRAPQPRIAAAAIARAWLRRGGES